MQTPLNVGTMQGFYIKVLFILFYLKNNVPFSSIELVAEIIPV